jgi:hypothetical protein
VKRAILGNPSPWDRLDLPHEEMSEEPASARPRRTAVARLVPALRADRMATVRQVLADLTDAKLAGMTEPVSEPGYPSRRASRYAGACRPSSTGDGSTGCTPNGTSTCSSPGRPDP